MGRSFKFDSGIDPKYQDQDVRFRTTYYFRVFDICDVLDEDNRLLEYKQPDTIFNKRTKGIYKLQNDSLYRFRMTGKASALFHDIAFESGTLRAEQIDPFGASIDYDETSRKFHLASPSQNRELHKRTSIYKEVKNLYSLLEDTKDDSAKTKIQQLILEQLDNLATKGSVSQLSSAAILVTTAKDLAIRVVEELKLLLDDPSPLKGIADELNKVVNSNSVDDLNKSIKPLIDVLQRLSTVIQTSLKQQVTSGDSGTAPLTSAVQKRKQAAADAYMAAADAQMAAADMQKAATDTPSLPTDQGQGRDETATKGTPSVDLQEAKERKQEKEKELLRSSEELNRIREKLSKLNNNLAKVEEARKTLIKASEEKLREKADSSNQNGVTKYNPACPNGTPSRRGFQVLGPEGFRSFDPDERLVMALSIDSKPLISMLQELTDQRFGGDADKSADYEMGVRTERWRVDSSKKALDELRKQLEENKSLTTSDILTKVLRAFNKLESQSKPGEESAGSLLKNLDTIKR
ncbi:MAG: hypothetical protein AB7L09_14930 [Nitrospira sp.]